MLPASVLVFETAFPALHLASEGCARELRITDSISWYAQGRLSQDKATENTELSLAAFIDTLSAATALPFPIDADHLYDELAHAH